MEAGWASVSLLAATVLSLWLANHGPASAAWVSLWEHHVGWASLGLHLSLREWVNEGLMAIFFFVGGVEIKKELTYGSLATTRKAILPCLGAVGGMLVPMAIYTALNVAGRAGASSLGWAVPMATDIAFAKGILAFFKPRMPVGAVAFLLTLATVDDLGALAVIALFFAGNMNLPFMFAAAAICAGLAYMNQRGSEKHLPVYLLLGVGLWYSLLRGGVNVDLASVATAMALPAPPKEEGVATLLDRLHHTLAPVTAFFIMPCFALANMAIPLSGTSMATFLADFANSGMSQGIALGLLFGKPIGIALFSLVGIRLGVARWPTGMRFQHLLTIAFLGGIGCTMSIFLIHSSFHATPHLAASAKLAVMCGSALAAFLAVGCILWFPRLKPRPGYTTAPII